MGVFPTPQHLPGEEMSTPQVPLTNAQTALLAASQSYHSGTTANSILLRADRFKDWLDAQDRRSK